jgi:hypothetical protein
MAFASALEAASRGETFHEPIAAVATRTRQKEVPVSIPKPHESTPVETAPAKTAEPLAPVAPVPASAKKEPEKRRPPERDDIAAEQEEDAAFFALANRLRETEEAREAAETRDLFDMEAVEDLAIEAETERFKDDFDPGVLDQPREEERFSDTFDSDFESEAKPPSTPASIPLPERRIDDEIDERAYAPPPRRSIDYVPPEPYPAAEPPRRRSLPLMLMLMLGLIVGFGLGWGARSGVGSGLLTKKDAPQAQADETPAASQPPAEAGKAYSEQAVTPQQPPSQPPPIPTDAPAPSSSTPASGNKAAPSTPPSKTPAPSATETGRIIVRSVPANAGVTVNGAWRGRTPLTLEKVRLGTHEVRVVQPGFQVGKQSVTLTPNAPARTLSFRLQQTGNAPPGPSGTSAAPSKPPTVASPSPSASTRSGLPPVADEPRGPGSLFVDSRPRGAVVFLDGKRVGTTPTTIRDVTPGSHLIRLELPEHRTWTSNSEVLPGQQTQVRGSLERIR